LVSQVYTPGREGTLRTDILAAARRNGRLAVPVSNLSDLLLEIAAGHPVLVFQNLGLSWYSQWHFAVAIAYDLDAGEIVLHSGVEERRITPLKTFERTWARGDYWALVILPPGVLPATPDVHTVLKAAASLERVRRHSEAATAYQVAAQKWPENYGALMGLGNARYALGDLNGSQKAFRRAVNRHPEKPGGWNNLAHVLGRQGRKAEALKAAQEAVRLGGKDVETYRETLREVSGG
jgi:tetratricopeptide (TPR) repeat protein